jgi:hypothetical protein
MTCSMIAWSRCRASASMLDRVELVMKAWVPVGGEQFLLPGLAGAEAADAAHHEPAGHVVCFAAGGEHGDRGLGDLASETHRCSVSSHTAFG